MLYINHYVAGSPDSYSTISTSYTFDGYYIRENSLSSSVDYQLFDAAHIDGQTLVSVDGSYFNTIYNATTDTTQDIFVPGYSKSFYVHDDVITVVSAGSLFGEAINITTYDSSGQPIDFEVWSLPNVRVHSTQIIELSNGNLLVAAEQGGNISARLYEGSDAGPGALIDDEFLLTSSHATIGDWEIAALKGGGYVLVIEWLDDRVGTWQTGARFFNSDGEINRAEIRVTYYSYQYSYQWSGICGSVDHGFVRWARCSGLRRPPRRWGPNF